MVCPRRVDPRYRRPPRGGRGLRGRWRGGDRRARLRDRDDRTRGGRDRAGELLGAGGQTPGQRAVGIDGFAGPSEVMIVADASADPRRDRPRPARAGRARADSVAALASDDPAFIDAVAAALADEAAPVGAVTLVDCPTLDVAVALAEAFAPEHLEICAREATHLADRIRQAGAVFVGPNCATAYGDYVAGSNHVLPTGGAARFASALGPSTYLRRMSIVEMTDSAVSGAHAAPGAVGRGRGIRLARPLGGGARSRQ